MFDYKGKQIKKMAKIFYIIGVSLSVISLVVVSVLGILGTNLNWIWYEIGVFVGMLLWWLVCTLVYGFGELIETNYEIMDKLDNLNKDNL